MDTNQFSGEFEGFQGELKSFLLRITASAQDAEDLVQETYLKAHRKLEGFRGEASLKTWVFTIAANLARDMLRARKRWPENVTDICRDVALGNADFMEEALHIRQTSPQGNFEIREHIAFCLTCVAKSLPLEQQLTLLLKEVYGFKLKEIAGIIDQSEAMVKYHLNAARNKMIEIFDRRCSLINKQGVCYQCTELNGIFNPRQQMQEELVKIAMLRDAEKQSKQCLFDLRLQILRDLDPFGSGAAELQLFHLEHNRKVMQDYLADQP